MGAGTQNLISIFLMLSWSVFSSRYQEVWSWADAPAVGSGAPQYVLMALGWADSNSSSKRCAVGNICWGSSLIRYWANFCNCSRCNLDSDSETGALRHTCVGWNVKYLHLDNRFGLYRFYNDNYHVYSVEANRNDVRTPIGRRGTGAVAGSDSSPIKRYRNIVLFSVATRGYHHRRDRRTEVEPWEIEKN